MRIVARSSAEPGDRLGAVARHVDSFVAETALVGVPEWLARSMVGPDLLTVTIEVAERYDETPGPGAGRAL
jgi:hypothetical protein